MDAKAAMKAELGEMEKRLQHWGAKVDEFVAKAEKVGAEAKSDFREGLDELKAKYRTAQARLDELKAADSERWSNFKAGVESAWHELEATFKKLKS